MQFLFKLLSVVSVVLVAVATVSAQDENEIISDVSAVMSKAYNLQIFVSELDDSDVTTVGGEISGDIESITLACEQYAGQLQNDDPTPLSDSASEEVILVTEGMCETVQALLRTFEDQHSLLARYFLAETIYHDLDELKDYYDTFVAAYSPYIPSQEDELQSLMNGVTAAFTETLRVYKH